MEPKNLTGNYGPTCFEARAQGMKSNSKNFTKTIPTMGQKMTLLPLFSLLFSFLSMFFLLFFYSSLLFTLCVLSLSFLFLLLYLSSSASSHFSLPFFPFKHSHFAAKGIKLLGVLLNQHWSSIEVVLHGAQFSTEPY